MMPVRTVRRGMKGICIVMLIALIGIGAGAADIFVAPVPWVPESYKTVLGNLTDGMTFSNLPLEGEIFIYTLSGTLVAHLEFNDGTRKAKWFGRNDEGEDVASGVYFWVVKSGEGVKTGKLVVVR